MGTFYSGDLSEIIWRGWGFDTLTLIKQLELRSNLKFVDNFS